MNITSALEWPTLLSIGEIFTKALLKILVPMLSISNPYACLKKIVANNKYITTAFVSLNNLMIITSSQPQIKLSIIRYQENAQCRGVHVNYFNTFIKLIPKYPNAFLLFGLYFNVQI